MQKPPRKFQCMACGYVFEVPHGLPRPMACPRCGAPGHMIHRVDRGRHRWGWARRLFRWPFGRYTATR